MIKKISLSLIVLGFMFLLGCSEDVVLDVVEDEGSIDYPVVTNQSPLELTNQVVSNKMAAVVSNFNYSVSLLPEILQPSVLTEPVLVGIPYTNTEDSYQTVLTRYKIATGFDTHILLDPTSDVIWPGGLLDGNTIRTGSYVPIVTKNRPLTISISLENIWGKKSRLVEDAKLSTVRDAVGEILAQNVNGSTPAKVSFTITEVHSEEQLKVALGAHYNGNISTIKSHFDFSDSTIKSRVIVQFVQVYYTIDIDSPVMPSSFFSEQADWSQLQAKMSGTSPVYVSTVKYGRLALFSFESTADINELKMAINYSFNAVVSGGVDVSVTNINILNSTTIKATILGGDGAAAAGSVNGFNGLKNYLTTGGNYNWNSPGAPIGYKLRYLANNAIAEIVLAGEYTVVTKQRVRRRYRVKNIDIICIKEDDSGSTEELYGYINLKAYVGDLELSSDSGSPSFLWLTHRYATVDLAQGEFYRVGKSRDYSFAEVDIPQARLVFKAAFMENDTFGDDDLGEREFTIQLDGCEEKRYFVEGFSSGGTRVKIGFDLVLVQ